MAPPVQCTRTVRSLILAIALTGCFPDDEVVLFDERFEDGWALRWVRSGGVAEVETVHPGEHGIVFLEPGTIRAPIAVSVYDDFSDGVWLEYTSSCGLAPRLTIDGTRLWVDLPVSELDVHPDGAFELVHLSIPGSPLTLTDLTLATDGDPSDACVIDNVRILQPAVDHAY